MIFLTAIIAVIAVTVAVVPVTIILLNTARPKVVPATSRPVRLPQVTQERELIAA